jgi:hypothetical protein
MTENPVMRALARRTARDRVEALLGAQQRLQVRRILRALRRDLEALLAALVVEDEVLDFVGELEHQPRRLPRVELVAPAQDAVELRDGTVGRLLTAQARLVRGWPRLTLLVVEPGDLEFSAAAAILERATEKLEDLLLPLVG